MVSRYENYEIVQLIITKMQPRNKKEEPKNNFVSSVWYENDEFEQKVNKMAKNGKIQIFC